MGSKRLLARALVVSLLAVTIGVAPIQLERPAYAQTHDVVAEVIEALPAAESPDGAMFEGSEAPADGDDTGDELPSSAGSSDVASAGATENEHVSEEVAAPIPFSMVGFEATTPGDLEFRVSTDGAVWSEWEEAEFHDELEGPDGDEREAAPDLTRFTEPVWVGEATHLQVRSEDLTPEEIRTHLIDSIGLSRTLPEKMIDLAKHLARPVQPVTAEAVSRPSIVTRAQWGADESWRSSGPQYNDDVQFGVVHHTAGSNTYTASQAPGVVRGIYHYHTQTLGWSDIGYNFLIDRFGVAYEGRFGGMERGVVGAHSRGYNSGSFGVSLMGNHDVAQASSSAINSLTNVLAWKLDVHLVDPSVVPRRSGVNNAIIGHRDVGSTACPGKYVYELLPTIRRNVIAKDGFSLSKATPVTGDWNGDGVDTAGWFYNGRWWLRNKLTSGPPEIVMDYGRAGDKPVTGDWNDDGRDTIGVVRGNRWILRYEYRSGADIVLTYGRESDHPVTGDWNADGRDTIGVVRGNEWILRYLYRSGADIVMTYGYETDRRVTGDWNGDGRDTIGVVRGNRWILRYEYRSGADIVFNY